MINLVTKLNKYFFIILLIKYFINNKMNIIPLSNEHAVLTSESLSNENRNNVPIVVTEKGSPGINGENGIDGKDAELIDFSTNYKYLQQMIVELPEEKIGLIVKHILNDRTKYFVTTSRNQNFSENILVLYHFANEICYNTCHVVGHSETLTILEFDNEIEFQISAQFEERVPLASPLLLINGSNELNVGISQKCISQECISFTLNQKIHSCFGMRALIAETIATNIIDKYLESNEVVNHQTHSMNITTVNPDINFLSMLQENNLLNKLNKNVPLNGLIYVNSEEDYPFCEYDILTSIKLISPGTHKFVNKEFLLEEFSLEEFFSMFFEDIVISIKYKSFNSGYEFENTFICNKNI
jgi:hypothetical protein